MILDFGTPLLHDIVKKFDIVNFFPDSLYRVSTVLTRVQKSDLDIVTSFRRIKIIPGIAQANTYNGQKSNIPEIT